jgi:hypothetical protein
MTSFFHAQHISPIDSASRRAGIQHAANATAASGTGAAAKVIASRLNPVEETRQFR